MVVFLHRTLPVEQRANLVYKFIQVLKPNQTVETNEGSSLQLMEFYNQTKKDPDSVERFVFTKSSKTGSSTVANLLFRYVKNNNLNILIPRKSHHIWWDKPKGEWVL